MICLGGQIAASAPLAAADLGSRTQRGAHTAGTEQSGRGTVVFAEIEVDVATCSHKLICYFQEGKICQRVNHTQRVRSSQATLTAQRIPTRRAKIVHLHHNTLRTRQRGVVGVRVRLGGELEAQSATGTRTRAGTDTEQVLRGGGVVTWVRVPAAGCGGGVAVSGAEAVAGTVSEGGMLVSGWVWGGEGAERGETY